jgi:hypothetical protein
MAGVASASKIDEVRATVYAWGNAWESRDISNYMSFYSPTFRSKGLNYQSWIQKKAKLFQKPGDVRVKISDLWVFIEGTHATARFVQRYQDPRVSDVGEKKLVMVNTNGKWQIVSEDWKPLPIPVKAKKDRVKPSTPQKLDTKAKTASQGPKQKDLPAEKIIVTDIKFKAETDREQVCIALNNFCTPEVMTLKGDKPRVVIDIKNVPSWSGNYKTPVNGKLIKQIRTFLHRDIEKFRIVLDLNSFKNYSLDKTYNTEQNIFCVVVR